MDFKEDVEGSSVLKNLILRLVLTSNRLIQLLDCFSTVAIDHKNKTKVSDINRNNYISIPSYCVEANFAMEYLD